MRRMDEVILGLLGVLVIVVTTICIVVAGVVL